MRIVRLEQARLTEASAVLARAFQDDPAWAWIIPDAERRARLLPWLFRIGFDVTAAEVWATAGTLRGAARWLPPGRPPMRLAATLRALAATPFRLGGAMVPFLAYGRAVETLRVEAMPGPHWYLAGIGVDPEHQRHGIGSALLEPGLTAAARDRVPAVLLTNTEANLPFYEHRGFRVVAERETPAGGPHCWAMVRSP